MNTSIKQSRNASLDLLRILSMAMVIMRHVFIHGGLKENLEPFSFNFFIGNTICALCSVCVNCFVLISGYFLCQARFQLRRIVTIWGLAFFYSVSIYLFLVLASGDAISGTKLARSCLVFSFKQYWFVTVYLLLLLLSPFLNKMICAMTKREHGILCVLLLLVFSVLANVIYICDFSGVDGGYSLTFFCVLYILSAYFRLYIPERWNKKAHALVGFGYVFFSLLIVGECALAYFVTPHIWGEPKLTSLFSSYNSIACVGATLCLFQFFRGLNLGEGMKRVVSIFAPLAFAVYLIHDHPEVRKPLWDILSPARFADSPFMTVYIVLCVAGIFLICCLIEYIRRALFRALGIGKQVARISQIVQDRILGRDEDEREL